MVIIFIIILVIVFFFLFFSRRQRRNNFQNIIKARELKTDQSLDPQPKPIFVGEGSETDFITYDTQFMFKINNNYLNNGVGCKIRNSKSNCLNKKSEIVTEAVLNDIKNKNKNKTFENAKSADFKFIEVDRMKSKYVSYGSPVLIQNIGNTKSYLSLCLDETSTFSNYCIVTDIYFYNNIDDALIDGRWIIIPKYNDGNGIDYNDSKYNFYEDYDLGKLRSLDIPVKLTDNFLIINEKKLNGKFVYLNLLDKEHGKFVINCDENKYNACVGLSSITEDYIDQSNKMNITYASVDDNLESYLETRIINPKDLELEIDGFKPKYQYDDGVSHYLRLVKPGVNLTDYLREEDMNMEVLRFSNKTITKNENNVKYVLKNWKDGTSNIIYSDPKKPDERFVKILLVYSFANGVDLSIIDQDLSKVKLKRTNQYLNQMFDGTVVTSPVKYNVNLYEWSIEPLEYDITVFDTLLVEGSIKLHNYEITTDTLKYIKSLPFHFKDKICIKPTDDIIKTDKKDDGTPRLNEDSFKCIGKPELEMLNGSRPINIKSTVVAKPFVLYSRPEYQGRSLRVGFNYENRENLPFFEYNRFLNKGDDGKWKSLFIDGNYIAIIFNKPDYGYGGSEIDLSVTLDEIIAEEEATKAEQGSNSNTSGNIKSNNNNNNNNSQEEEVKGVYQVIRPPGIKNVMDLGENWKDGIRSVQFLNLKMETLEGDAYELKCLENISFNNDINVRGNKKGTNNIYTANTCLNGNKEQQFYLTNMYDTIPDKEFTLSKLYDNLDISHIHFHRHKFDDEHN